MYKTGIWLMVIGAIINWYAFFKIKNPIKIRDYYIWGTAIAFLGLGLTIATPSK